MASSGGRHTCRWQRNPPSLRRTQPVEFRRPWMDLRRAFQFQGDEEQCCHLVCWPWAFFYFVPSAFIIWVIENGRPKKPRSWIAGTNRDDVMTDRLIPHAAAAIPSPGAPALHHTAAPERLRAACLPDAHLRPLVTGMDRDGGRWRGISRLARSNQWCAFASSIFHQSPQDHVTIRRRWSISYFWC
jgi:hypothetical protein